MRITLWFDLWLASRRCWFVFFQKRFTFLKNLASFVWIFWLTLVSEFVKIGFRKNNVRMIFGCVQNDMEKANSSTSILSVLFHEEDILRNLLRMKACVLLVSMLRLDRSDFVKEKNSEYWLRNHLKSPFLSGEHLLEGEKLSFESHLLNEGVNDFRVGFKRHPVLVVLLHCQWFLNKL